TPGSKKHQRLRTPQGAIAMLTRRQLLKTSAATGVALSLPWTIRPAYPFAQSPTTIPLFGTTLRGIGTIGVAASDGSAPVTGVTHYTININQFTDQICPSSS